MTRSTSERADTVAHNVVVLVTQSLIACDATPRLVRRALLSGPHYAGTPLANRLYQFTAPVCIGINAEAGIVSRRSDGAGGLAANQSVAWRRIMGRVAGDLTWRFPGAGPRRGATARGHGAG